jgi:hypothetical protein
MPLIAPPPGTQATHLSKRALAAFGAAVAAAGIGLGTWAVVSPGSYGQSHEGCITVTIPNSTGGALLHECGSNARSVCRAAFRRDDRLALLTRPACRQAGLG